MFSSAPARKPSSTILSEELLPQISPMNADFF